MKKRLVKILTLALASIMTVGTLFGCAETGNVRATCPEGFYFPEYKIEDSGKTYESFAYGGTRGLNKFDIDGVVIENDIDFSSKEKLQEYKDAGFTVLFMTFSDDEENLRVMDIAHELGLKCIITDFWILDGVTTTGKLIDENNPYPIVGRKFQNMDQLKEALKVELSVYCSHPAFFGLNLRDEPTIAYLEDYGDMYRGIRAAETELKKHDGTFFKEEEIYLHANLLPLGINDAKAYWDDASTTGVDYTTLGDAYNKYVRAFLAATGANHFSVDIYEFRRDGIFPGFFSTMQMFRTACKEYGAEMTYVQQSFNTFTGSTESYARITRAEMMSETYTSIGMGVTHFSYYTYLPYASQSINGTHTINHFMTWNGEKTNVYYYGQAAMKEAKFLSDIVYNYNWQGAKFIVNPNPDEMRFGTAAYLGSRADTNTGTNAPFDQSHEFTLVKNVTIDNDILLLSELKDEKNNMYMYMVQNVLNPRDAQVDVTDVNVSVEFDATYEWVAEISDGVINYVKLDNGVYKNTLAAGYATFIVPLAKVN